MRRWSSASRVAAAVIAFGVGCWGWAIETPPSSVLDWGTIAYKTLQMITLQFPGGFDLHENWQLQAARFAVPLTVAVFSVGVLTTGWRRSMREVMLPFLRRHAIVIGETACAIESAPAIARSGRSVILIASMIADDTRDMLEAKGVTVQIGDARLATVRAIAKPSVADVLLVATSSNLANIDIALSFLQDVVSRDAQLLVQISDVDLAVAATRTFDQASSGTRLRPRVFSPLETIASEIFTRSPFVLERANRERPHHLAMIGCGCAGISTLRAALPLLQDSSVSAPKVTILTGADDDAPRDFLAQHPALGIVAEVEIICGAGTIQNLLRAHVDQIGRRSPVDTWIIATPSAEINLALALSIRNGDLGGAHAETSQPIYILFQGSAAFVDFVVRSDFRGFDGVGIRPYGHDVGQHVVDSLLSVSRDQLARAIHDDYFSSQGHTFLETSSVPWEDLPETFRSANRAAAAHVDVKLAAIGWRRTKAKEGWTAATPTPAEIEILARMEHRRWCTERILAGWGYDNHRNDRRKNHPSIVPYDDLDESEKQKDRNQIRAIARQLSLIGEIPVREHVIAVRPSELHVSADRFLAEARLIEVGRTDEIVVLELHLPESGPLDRLVEIAEGWTGPIRIVLPSTRAALLDDPDPARRSVFRHLMMRADKH
jgi:hypothetical protein